MDKSKIKVAAASSVPCVAGSIAYQLREHGAATVQAIGAGAVNQSVKALIVARGYMEVEGITLTFKPSFTSIEIDGQDMTAIVFDAICTGGNHGS